MWGEGFNEERQIRDGEVSGKGLLGMICIFLSDVNRKQHYGDQFKPEFV